MFGFACNETAELMPAPIQLAHTILRNMAEARRCRHCAAASVPMPRARSASAIVDGKPVCATSVVVSTQHAPELSQDDVRELVRPFVLADPAGRLDVPGGRLLRQSDRQVRDRRPGRRCRPDRAQDHRRHLWRRSAPWRRRLLRQGSDQGRPLGRLCRPLSGQERGRGRPRRALPDPALLRDRHLQAALGLRRHQGHRRGRSGPPERACCAS